jgi:hypothetical protein
VKVLAIQQYIKVTRMIKDNIQYHKEEEYTITLTSELVCTTFDTFLIDEVWDISYRFFSENMGFLYLHTIKGVYSYTIKVSPQNFIDQFKLIK